MSRPQQPVVSLACPASLIQSEAEFNLWLTVVPLALLLLQLISESGWSDEEETRQQRKRQTEKLSLKRKAGASGQKRSRRGTSSTPARSPAKAGTPKKKAASELPFAVGSSVWVEYGKVSYAAQVVDYDAAEGEYRVRYDNARNSDEWVQSDMVKHPDFFNTRRREKRAVKQYQS